MRRRGVKAEDIWQLVLEAQHFHSAALTPPVLSSFDGAYEAHLASPICQLKRWCMYSRGPSDCQEAVHGKV